MVANIAGMDDNSRRALSALSSVDNTSIVNLWADPITHRLLVDNAGSSSGLTVGSTTISGGTTTKVLFDNAGVLGEYTIVGTGSVVMSGSPTFTGQASFSDGTANAPSITFTGDLDTGIYHPSSNEVAISTSGTDRMIFYPAGGIDLFGTVSNTGAFRALSGAVNSPTYSWLSETTSGLFRNGVGDLRFSVGGAYVQSWSTTGSVFIGNVGIGNVSPSFKLDIDGGGASDNFRISNSTSGGEFTVRDGIIDSTRSDGLYIMFSNNTKAVNFQSNKVIFSGSGGIAIMNSTVSELLTLGTAGTTAGTLSLAGATSGKVIVVVPSVAGAGTLTLPAATDTLVGKATTDTLTNKRITPRVLSAASYTTDTGSSINGDTQDMFIVTAQTGALKFNNPSGTPTDGQKLIISVASSTTAARALTWDTAYGATTVALPTTTAATTVTLTIGFIWSASKSLWQCVATA